MKTLKYILVLLCLTLTNMASAQVVEFHVNENYHHDGQTHVHKFYLSDIDSIVYVPALDWTPTVEIKEFYRDEQEQMHVRVHATTGPDADFGRLYFGDKTVDANYFYYINRNPELDTLTNYVEIAKGSDVEMDYVVPDLTQDFYFSLITANLRYNPASATYYSATCKADYAYWLENKDWKDIGMATYREDMVTRFWGVENVKYEVPIQKHRQTEGLYRLINPYGAYYPYNENGDYDANANSYWVIHAEDPEYVWVETHVSTMDWGYGVISFGSLVNYQIENGASVEGLKETKPELFGKLDEGVITFPTANSLIISMANYQNGSWYYSNVSGLFAIALPGKKIPDYTTTARFVEIQKATTEDEKNQAVVEFTLGPDVAWAEYAMTSASTSEQETADAIIAGTLSSTKITQSSQVSLPLEQDGKYRVTIVAFNSNGAAKAQASCAFTFETGKNWISLGMGQYTDDIVGPLFNAGPIAYEVEVFEHKDTPGLYRLKNAYGAGYPYNEEGDWDASMDYFLEINAVDPTSVYFEQQELGLDWGSGMMSAVSNAARYIAAGYDIETIKANNIEFGTLVDGVMTFPVKGIIVFDDDGGYYANNNGAFKLVLPGYSSNAQPATRKVDDIKLMISKSKKEVQPTFEKKRTKHRFLKPIRNEAPLPKNVSIH